MGQCHRAKLLITNPYQNWKDAHSGFLKHSLEYHKAADAKRSAFLEVRQGSQQRVDLILSIQSQKQLEKNRKFLISIIKSLEWCARQGIDLRKSRDDGFEEDTDSMNMGNFKALLYFRIDAGDSSLQEHLQTCPKNATYISKTTQNQLLDCMREVLQDKI